MFDTIHLRLRQDDLAGGVNFIESLPYLLTDVSTHQSEAGEVWVRGNLGNLTIRANHFQMSVKDGSLCRWYLGDNFQTMGRGEARRAIECLSDMLHLPMSNAAVTRLDLAANFIMKYPPTTYLDHLGELRYNKRLPQPDGLYYAQHDKRLCFYDKVKEQKNKHEEIPEVYLGQNVLRYEQRYLQRVARNLSVPDVRASMLYDDDFYHRLVLNWRDTYRAIKKINLTNFDFTMIKGKKQLYKMGVLALVNMSGGKNEFLRQIDEAGKRGELDGKQKSDLRAAVNEACKIDGSMVTQSDAVAELDKKINEAVRIYG